MLSKLAAILLWRKYHKNEVKFYDLFKIEGGGHLSYYEMKTPEYKLRISEYKIVSSTYCLVVMNLNGQLLTGEPFYLTASEFLELKNLTVLK